MKVFEEARPYKCDSTIFLVLAAFCQVIHAQRLMLPILNDVVRSVYGVAAPFCPHEDLGHDKY